MNLLLDPVFPVMTRDLEVLNVNFSELINPNLLDFHFPRDDLQGAAYQFAIAVLQTGLIFEGSMCLESGGHKYTGIDDDEEWFDYRNSPSKSKIGCMIENLKHAFYITDHNRLFMQDIEPLSRETSVSALFIDSPGENTLKENKDFFIKRDKIDNLCLSMAAFSLFTLQINAPSGGQGHRTGVRGGGPLSTLVFPHSESSSLWEKLWMNIIVQGDWIVEREVGSFHNPGLFPWLGKTRVSDKQQVIAQNEEGVDQCHVFWATPRRIKLILEVNKNSEECSVSGNIEQYFVKRYQLQNYGNNYSENWRHPLTPYSQKVKRDKGEDIISGKPEPLFSKKGENLSYLSWLPMVYTQEKKGLIAASVVENYHDSLFSKEIESEFDYPFLYCFGYDMDNMKAKCWYSKRFPLITVRKDKKEVFLLCVNNMIKFVEECSFHCRTSIKNVLSKYDKKPDYTFVNKSFLLSSEEAFFTALEQLKNKNLEEIGVVLNTWSYNVKKIVLSTFDSYTIKSNKDLVGSNRLKKLMKERNHFINKINKSIEKYKV